MMSRANPYRSFYIYSISPGIEWRSLALSLENAYPNRVDMYSLAMVHQIRRTIIGPANVPADYFFRVREYRNGQLIRLSMNQAFDQVTQRTFSDEPYNATDRAYDPQLDFAYAHVGNFLLPACLAAALCNNNQQRFFGPALATPAMMCPNLKFDRMPVKNYLAQSMLPVLFITNP